MIRISGDVLRAIHAHAERDYPHECCGALLGRDAPGGAGARVVVDVLASDNRRGPDAAASRFLITGDDLRAMEKVARDRSMDVLGFYHSHPDHPARPSDYDREHALPWYSYVIVSVRGGRAEDTTSWLLRDDRTAFAQEPIDGAPPRDGRAPGSS